MMVLCLLINHLCCLHNKSKNAKRPIKYITRSISIGSIVCIVSGIIASSLTFIHTGYFFITDIDMFYSPTLFIITPISEAFYYIECISLYVVVFSRVYYTFKDGIHALNKFTIFIVSSLIILTSLGMMLNCALLYLMTKSPNFYDIQNITATFFITTDFILSIVMLTLFVYKLQKVIVLSARYELNTNDDIKFNRHQSKLISVITKNTVLSSTAIVWNQMYFASYIIGGYFGNVHANDKELVSIYWLIFSNPLIVFVTTLDAVILYLNFGFNVDKYYKICSFCDRTCYQCCMKLTKKKVMDGTYVQLGTE